MEGETLDNGATTDADEVSKLKFEREHLKSELEAVLTQEEIFRATVEQLQIERNALELQIKDQKSEKKVLEAVAARASDLEGDVARLQHDLVTVVSECEELQGKLTEANLIEQRLIKEKNELADEKNVKGLTVIELEGKLKSLEKEKEAEVRKLESEKRELQETISFYHLMENGKRVVDDGDSIMDRKFSWTSFALGAGAVTAVTVTAFLLRYSKNR